MSKSATMQDYKVIVIGTSAGGMSALTRLLKQFPPGFPAAVFVVQHMSADSTGKILEQTLSAASGIPCALAQNGSKVEPGRIYIGVPDNHLLIDNETVLVTKGAQENRSRPAIDPLFRSAAVAYGNRVIGVLLTGYLDDGTAGLIAIQRCGGICLIQDPADAEYPDMPQNALNQLVPEFCVPLDQMGALLGNLVTLKVTKREPVPADIAIEAKIAQRVLSDLHSVGCLGNQVPFNCPGCGGVLWQVGSGNHLRYRCHTGHAYTAEVLWAEQSKKIEETLWVALRMFEERRNLLTTIAAQQGPGASSASERAEASIVHIERIRAMLLSNESAGATVQVRGRAIAPK